MPIPDERYGVKVEVTITSETRGGQVVAHSVHEEAVVSQADLLDLQGGLVSLLGARHELAKAKLQIET